MNNELKLAIINYMFEHSRDFQLVNNAVEKFRPYIFDAGGEYLIGGKVVYRFIKIAEEIVKL